MTRQTWIALLLAVLAALLVYYYISEKEAAIKADVTLLKVLIAKQDIGRGMAITSAKVMIDEIPGAYVMPGAISSPRREEVVKQWQQAYQGQFAVVSIAKGEQILPNKLSQLLPGFATVVPMGKRITAFTLVNASAVGGHLTPGNYVDVLGTFEHQYQNMKRTTAVMLAQNLLVTAVGDQTAMEKKGLKLKQSLPGENVSLTVCLAVTPEDAVRLALAEKEGALKLTLRSVGDENLIEVSDQNIGSLLGPLMKVQKDQIKSAPKHLEIIRGME